MTKTLKKLATATLSAAICLVALKANPTQAATFDFSGSWIPFGRVSFDDATSGLTGIGREVVTLSPSNGNLKFNLVAFHFTSYLSYFPTWTEADFLTPPVFTFESGSLIGMNLNLPPKTANTYVPGQGPYAWTGTIQVFIQDTSVRNENSQLIRIGYDYKCLSIPNIDIEECRRPDQQYSWETTGELKLQTIVPFQRPTSVPEPGSVVGLSLLGLAFLLKKKTASSQG
jgi:hypothetical protein